MTRSTNAKILLTVFWLPWLLTILLLTCGCSIQSDTITADLQSEETESLKIETEETNAEARQTTLPEPIPVVRDQLTESESDSSSADFAEATPPAPAEPPDAPAVQEDPGPLPPEPEKAPPEIIAESEPSVAPEPKPSQEVSQPESPPVQAVQEPEAIPVTTLQPADNAPQEGLRFLDSFIATAYYLTGLTSTGAYTTVNHTLAVNPNIIPYGTHVWIWLEDGTYVGDFYAEDTGSNMMAHPYVIDIYMGNSYDACIQWGARNVLVYIEDEAV